MVETTPVYRSCLWGGDRLRTMFHKTDGPTPLAESWELSTHPTGMTTVEGEPLSDYLERRGAAKELPILVKLIDAAKPLSVQVHPTDRAAAPFGERGKTEAWHILAAEEDAFLYLGVREPISKEAFLKRIQDGTVEEILCRIPVRAGETYFVPAGVLHAIGAGIVLLEVQQSSDVTYRVYDYNRTDDDGKPRPLHVAQALEVAALAPVDCTPPNARETERGRVLVECPYFTLEEWTDTERGMVCEAETESFLFVSEGSFLFSDGEAERTVREGSGVLLVRGERITATGTGRILFMHGKDR